MPDSQRISILVDDMFFASKIRAAAQAAERDVQSVKSIEQLEKMIEDPPFLVIVDLNSDRLNPIEALGTIKSAPAMQGIPIVGFLSHVQIDLKQAAEERGCDYVIPRSLFSMKLSEIVNGNLLSLPTSQSDK